ncbi:uncharacterized protein LOC135334573 isoform X2 [Halichondria panicea]|uniref:uncharacterized protein LOC135334573 isoform X2 n=1 Tax=Halichondria panicea TaxID=6063 RepID=UPI00312B2AFB
MASKDATSIEVIRDEIEGTNLGLGTSDLQLIDLYGALFEARAKWRPIGLELRLTPGTLDAIEQMKINPSDRLEAVLLHWLRVTRGASWKQVIDALRSALVGEIQLAEKLELKYCPPETGHREKRKYRSDDEQQLTNDIKSIEKKFTNLQTATRESLKKSDTVDLLSLVALLTSYRSSRAVIESESNMLLAHQQEELRRAASIDEVFVIVSPFWSFLDFEILEDVINKFGAESDQSDLATYFIELKDFLNTWKIEPCKISRLDDDKKRVKFCFKLDADSLAIYRDLKAAIARILKVPVYALHLHSIENGSIQLLFFFLGIVQLSFHQCDQIAQIIPSVLKVSLIHGSTSEIIFEGEEDEAKTTPSPGETVEPTGQHTSVTEESCESSTQGNTPNLGNTPRVFQMAQLSSPIPSVSYEEITQSPTQNPGKTLAVSQASLVSQMAQLSSPIPSVSYEEPLQTLSCQIGSSLPVHIFLPHGSHITSAESADQDMASGVAQVSQTAEEHRTNDRQETTQFPTQESLYGSSHPGAMVVGIHFESIDSPDDTSAPLS